LAKYSFTDEILYIYILYVQEVLMLVNNSCVCVFVRANNW